MRILIICCSLFVSIISSPAQAKFNQPATEAIDLLNKWRQNHPAVWAHWHATGQVLGLHKDLNWDLFYYTEKGAATWRISIEAKSPVNIKMVISPNSQSDVSVFFPQRQTLSELKDDGTQPDFRPTKYLLSKKIDLDALREICRDITLHNNGDQQQLDFSLRPELYNQLFANLRGKLKVGVVFTFDNDGQVNFISWYYNNGVFGGKVEYQSFENSVVQKQAPAPPTAMASNPVSFQKALVAARKPSPAIKSVMIGILIVASISILVFLLKKFKRISKSNS